MAVSDFAAQTREHTFQSGRTVLVRESVSYMAIVSRLQRDEDAGSADALAQWASGETIDAANLAAAIRLNDVLVQEFVTQPRVLIPDIDPAGDEDGYGTGWCWISDFTDDELSELIDVAAQGVGQAHRFPGDAAGDGDREDGEDVGDAPKPRPRAKKRKS